MSKRERFEAKFPDLNFARAFNDEFYISSKTNWTYQGWQAALADRPEQPVARDEYLDGIMNRANPFHGAAPVARPEPAQPVAWMTVEALASLKDRDQSVSGHKTQTKTVALYAAPPSHPAPSAYVFSAHDQEILKDIEAMQHKDGWWERALAVGALRIIRSLAATQPAPSEAAPERQEKCSSAKNPLYCWNVRCQLSKTCIRAAQPAKGDAAS